MYLFSINATARQDSDDAKTGEVKPFIVYINYEDLFGAQALVHAYLLRAGFHKPEFSDQKHISSDQLKDHAKVAGNPQLTTALRDGYSIQLFEAK